MKELSTYCLALMALLASAAWGKEPYTIRSFEYNQFDNQIIWKDYNRDGREDLIIQSGNELNFFPQIPKNNIWGNPSQTLILPSSCQSFVFARRNKDGADSLFLLSNIGLDVLNFSGDRYTSPPVRLIETPLPFPEKVITPSMYDFMKDIDGDGADDLILPLMDNYSIYWSDNFTSPVLRIHYSQEVLSTIRSNRPFGYFFDCVGYQVRNRRGGGYRFIFHQYIFDKISSCGLLSIKDIGKPGTTQIIASRKTYTLNKNRTFSVLDTPKNPGEEQEKELSSFTDSKYDFNGDGQNDMIKLDTRVSTFSPQTTVQIFLARKNGEFPSKPDSEVRSPAISPFLYENPFSDIDGDGLPDLILLDLDLHGASVESNLKVFIKRGISGRLVFYLWEKGKGFPRKPNFSLPIFLTIQNFMLDQSLKDFLFMGNDLTGDGRPDLLIRTGALDYMSYRFIDRNAGYAVKPDATYHLPGDVVSIDFRDLNGDGANDLIFTCRNSKSSKIFLDVIYFSNIN